MSQLTPVPSAVTVGIAPATYSNDARLTSDVTPGDAYIMALDPVKRMKLGPGNGAVAALTLIHPSVAASNGIVASSNDAQASVVTVEGRLGVGMSSPLDRIHVTSNGNVRLDGGSVILAAPPGASSSSFFSVQASADDAYLSVSRGSNVLLKAHRDANAIMVGPPVVAGSTTELRLATASSEALGVVGVQDSNAMFLSMGGRVAMLVDSTLDRVDLSYASTHVSGNLTATSNVRAATVSCDAGTLGPVLSLLPSWCYTDVMNGSRLDLSSTVEAGNIDAATAGLFGGDDTTSMVSTDASGEAARWTRIRFIGRGAGLSSNTVAPVTLQVQIRDTSNASAFTAASSNFIVSNASVNGGRYTTFLTPWIHRSAVSNTDFAIEVVNGGPYRFGSMSVQFA